MVVSQTQLNKALEEINSSYNKLLNRLAALEDKVKTIRFGQQGVSGDKKPTARQKSFKARHASNIAKGKMSAAYWADKVKW